MFHVFWTMKMPTQKETMFACILDDNDATQKETMLACILNYDDADPKRNYGCLYRGHLAICKVHTTQWLGQSWLKRSLMMMMARMVAMPNPSLNFLLKVNLMFSKGKILSQISFYE